MGSAAQKDPPQSEGKGCGKKIGAVTERKRNPPEDGGENGSKKKPGNKGFKKSGMEKRKDTEAFYRGRKGGGIEKRTANNRTSGGVRKEEGRRRDGFLI